MAATDPPAGAGTAHSSPGVFRQLLRFVLIGGCCAIVDLGTYQLLRTFGMDHVPWADLARACSFTLGTTVAYFLNRRFTFAAGYRKGIGQKSGYTVVYGFAFCVAVGVNRLFLELLGDNAAHSSLAWVISQGTATVANFVLLKWVVFRVRAPRRS